MTRHDLGRLTEIYSHAGRTALHIEVSLEVGGDLRVFSSPYPKPYPERFWLQLKTV